MARPETPRMSVATEAIAAIPSAGARGDLLPHTCDTFQEMQLPCGHRYRLGRSQPRPREAARRSRFPYRGPGQALRPGLCRYSFAQRPLASPPAHRYPGTLSTSCKVTAASTPSLGGFAPPRDLAEALDRRERTGHPQRALGRRSCLLRDVGHRDLLPHSARELT